MNYKRKKCQRQGRFRGPSYNGNCKSMGNTDARYYLSGRQQPRQAKSKKNRIDPNDLD